MAAGKDGVFGFHGCCWPGSGWGSQGGISRARSLCRDKQHRGPRQAVPGVCCGGSQGAEFGLCLLTPQQLLVPQGTAKVWMQQKGAGLILAARTPFHPSQAFPYLLPACSSQGTSSARNLTAVDLIVYSSNTRPIYKSFHPISFYLIWMFRCQSK